MFNTTYKALVELPLRSWTKESASVYLSYQDEYFYALQLYCSGLYQWLMVNLIHVSQTKKNRVKLHMSWAITNVMQLYLWDAKYFNCKYDSCVFMWEWIKLFSLPSDVEKRENPVCHFVTPLDGNMDSDVRPAEVKIENSRPYELN